MERKMKLLNSTFDVALRLLAILTTCREAMTEDRLTIYSYFSLHLADMRKGEKSTHPDLPYRYSGFLKSKEVIIPAVELLLSKGLIDCDFTTTNFRYVATEMGIAFYSQIDGEYKQKLIESINKVHYSLKRMSDQQLNLLISNELYNWGSEFKYESVINEHNYD